MKSGQMIQGQALPDLITQRDLFEAERFVFCFAFCVLVCVVGARGLPVYGEAAAPPEQPSLVRPSLPFFSTAVFSATSFNIYLYQGTMIDGSRYR